MATPQLSPGVLTREVDLTVGRADNVLDNIGAIAGPFRIGPVDEPIDVTTEEDLINSFGKPLSTDAQYEYWMSAASYLSYGGVLKVCRTDSTNMGSANAGVGIASTAVAGGGSLKIKNFDDYNENWSAATDYYYAAKTPGSWANGLKVCQIDDLADQTLGITTTDLNEAGAIIGYAVTTQLDSVVIPGIGTTATYSGYLKGIITGVSTDSTNSESTIDVKVVARVSSAGTETRINYQENTQFAAFDTSDSLWFVNNSGINTGTTGGGIAAVAFTPTTSKDWYNEQVLGLENSTVFWKSLAPKPTTNNYVTERNGKNDAMHVAVVDDFGVVTGIQGNILEKHISLSKAEDAISAVNSPQKNYYKQFIAEFSTNLYAGYNPSQAADTYWGTEQRATGFSTACTPYTTAQGLWGQKAQDNTFSALGNVTYSLGGGTDYSSSIPATGQNGGMTATLASLKTSYNKFENKDEIAVDYLIMGPGLGARDLSQAKANSLLSIVGDRKDCVACIGPHRGDIVNVTNTTTQTTNLITYFAPLSSSTIFPSAPKWLAIFSLISCAMAFLTAYSCSSLCAHTIKFRISSISSSYFSISSSTSSLEELLFNISSATD